MTSADSDRPHTEEPFLRHEHNQENVHGREQTDNFSITQCPAPKAGAAPTVLNAIQTWEKFCALSIKVDTATGGVAPVEMDAALLGLIDAAQQEHQAVGCRWAEGLYLCAIMDGDLGAAQAFARQLQERLGNSRSETVSIGIAAFPQWKFSRGQILINTCKALDHAAFFGPGSVVSFDATSLNISGDKLYHAGNLDLAATEYRTGLALNPREANLHNSLGICHAKEGDFEAATTAFNAAIEIEPHETMAIYNLGMVALLKDEPQEAMARFHEAYGKSPDMYEIPFQIGKLSFEQGDWQTALAHLDEAIALNDRVWRLFNIKGACLAQLGATSQAIQAYGCSVKINPNDAEGLSALGCLYDDRGENPEICEAFFQQSIRLNPQNGLFHHRLGLWHQKHGRTELAMEAYRKASEWGHDAGQEMAALATANNDTADPKVRCA